ncbi:hypothetical protein ECE50_003720 [Chitinophaga sp. Mgbs1]|uniref:Protein glutaminase domain-containing protein n=1 Tax=Chitinophaga solisilvae TaxID=1233460 RepID=A0A433WDC6_9BACT|nr:hypothetical protein [Chitinophaga solisilvae]
MKKIFIGLIAVAAFAVMSVVSCKKDGHPETATPQAVNSDIVMAGNFTPFTLNTGNAGPSTVGFVQSARLYEIDLSRIGANVDADLLRKAIQDEIPVEVYLYRNTNKIAQVKPAGEPALAAYRKMQQAPAGPQPEAEPPVIPSQAALNSLWSQLASAPIPFSFATDGCYARAHKMRQIILNAGYDCNKYFAYGYLAASTGSCCVLWSYHVAPLVRFKTTSGAIEYRILDPSLFSGPVTQTQWLNACKNTGCSSSAYVSSTRTMPGNVYYVSATSNTPLYDNNYASTNCVIATYSGYSGCGPAPVLNCP